ncbi:tetratricopeptide repeat protein [Streptomyces sp. NPDC003233]
MSGDMHGRADGQGRVYQASRDQYIVEHHHHGEPGATAWTSPDSIRRPAVGRPPVALRDRRDLMDQLRRAVEPGTGNQVYVLHGMGGCGKTAVAYTLFQHATSEGDRIGLWVGASDPAALRGGMLAVAADRGAEEGELLAARSGLRAAADLVWERLDQSDRPWLLVLDNVDDPAVLQDGGWLRASPRGTVVVTTRQAAARWWPYAELHHVGVLPREEAAQVLCDLAPESGTPEEAAEIADRLGRLPLALTLAGGFLSHQVIEPWTMTQYGRRLDERDHVELLDQGAVALPREDSRHLVSRTWQFSLDALAAQGLPESTVLLQLLACYAPDPLPLSVLSSPELAAVLPSARTEAALRGLLDQSLTAVTDVGLRCVQTHGVLLASVAAGTPPQQVTTLTATAARLLGAVVPAIPEAGPPDLRLRLLAPHALALLRHASEALVTAEALDAAVRLAVSLHRTGDYLSALEVLTTAADIAEPTLGPDHRLVLSARARTGRSLCRLGRFEEAEALHRRVLAHRERLFGPDDPDTLDSRFALQFPVEQLGKNQESVELMKQTIAGRKRVLGPGHPLTLRSRVMLLECLPACELADVIDSAAVPLPQECATQLGPDHSITLEARLVHALALHTLGRFEAADEDARLVAEEFHRRYGPDYPTTLSAQTLCARIRACLGELDSAIELITDVSDRRERSLGADHPYTAYSRALVEEFRTKATATPTLPDLGG